MSAADHTGENQALFDAVHAVGMELCPALDLTIPVGKDSMSMRTAWQDENGEDKSITAPLSLVMTGFAPVTDAMRTTPQLRRTLNGEAVETDLILIDLGHGAHRLGGSALAQVYGQVGNEAPDLARPEDLKHFFEAIQRFNAEGKLLAYHDRSDGGLLTTLMEMSFAGRVGLDISSTGPPPSRARRLAHCLPKSWAPWCRYVASIPSPSSPSSRPWDSSTVA